MTLATSARATLSRSLRHLLPAALALATATCTQDNIGPSGSGVGYFTFRPSYQLAGGASLAQFGIVADSVRVLITRPVDQLVLDTTVFFPADSSELRLALPIVLEQSPDTLDAIIEITSGGVLLFRDSIRTEVFDGPPDASDIPEVVFEYVGPGTEIFEIDIIPDDTTIFLGDTVFFDATAIDSSEVDVPSFYVGWSTSDTAIARINADGRLIAPNVRSTVRVVGITPTGIADSTTITFAPTPVVITADSGDAQTAPTGDSLPELFVARVMGADSLGIAGIPVRFVAVDSTIGATVRDVIVVTDSTGRARTRGKLGLVATDYQFTATALGTGLPARVFTAEGTAAVPTAISIVSGNGQVDTVAQLLPLPLVVHVTDAFSNPVAGTPVVFATVFGDGTVGDDTVLTNASGNASIGYTLGISVGTDSVTATLAGTSAFAIFNARGIAGTPTQTQEFGGGGQTVAAGTPYPDSLVVRVFDTHDNPVPGAQVVWSIFAGTGSLGLDTTLTDSNGTAKNTLTAGAVAGELQVEARALPIVNGITITNHVIPAAPSAMTIGAGNGQTGNAGTPLPIAPTVHVVDSFGNVIAGVAVDFAVTAGGGSIDSATATTDSAGDANAGVWTLGPTAGGNQVRATSALVPADTLLFDATALPGGTTKLWTGTANNLWTDGSNWEPVGAPGITDNIFVPASAPSPLLNAATTISDLVIESGATLTANALFTVAGNIDIGGGLVGTGGVTITGTAPVLRGSIGNSFVTVQGTRSLSGDLFLGGSLGVSSGVLTVAGHTLAIGGSFTASGTGQLAMTSAADSVDVAGSFATASGTAGTGNLSDGVLVIRGNFTQTSGASNNFAPSGNHTVRMAGAAPQTIGFTNPGSAASRFQNLQVANAGGVTLTSNLSVVGVTTISAGTVTGIGRTAALAGSLVTSDAAWQVSTTQFSAAPAIYPDSLSRHVVVAAAWTLTKPFKVDSTFTITGTGVMALGGHALVVDGAFASSGRVVMTDAADSLDVTGGFTTTSGVTSIGDLTDGVLVLRGDFAQVGGSSANFQPSGAHRTRFLGSTPQSVNFSNVGGAASRFMGVEFVNAAGITLTSNVHVAGAATVTMGTVTGVGRTVSLAGDLAAPYAGWQVSNTSWVGSPSAYPDSLPRNLSLNAAMTLNKPFKVDSAVSIGSTGGLTLNGHSFRIGGSFTQGGLLTMQSAADTLDVTGPITVNSGTASTGTLTAGLLRVRGGFSQIGGSSSNFATSGTHTTRFEAAGGQTVDFTNAGPSSSRFQFLEVADSLNVTSTLYLAGATTLLPGGKVQSTSTATLAGPLSDSTNLGWRFQATVLSGTVTSVPDSIVSNVTLSGSWALARRTRITGTLAIGSTATLDLNGDTLLVSGAMTQGGVLASSDPAGALAVDGLFTVNSGSSGTGSLTEGHLVLTNGFVQVGGSSSNFAPTGNFLTTFAGLGGHTVSFTNPGTTGSRFHHLVVFDSLTFTSNLAATGNTTLDPAGRIVGTTRTGTLLGGLADPSGLGWRVTNTTIPGGQVVPDSLVTNLTLTGSWTLPARQWIDGALSIASTGVLDLGAQRLDVAGTMTQSGELRMLQNEDTLAVQGLLTVNSGQPGTNDLVDGVLILHGGFDQVSGSSANFAASSNHRTWFIGTTGQSVTFSNPSLASSHFHEVTTFDSLTLASNFAAAGIVAVDSGAKVMGAGRTASLGSSLVDGQVGWLVGTTIFAGPFPTLPATLVTDVILQDSLILPYNVTVTGDVSLQTNAYLGFAGHGLALSGDFTQSGQLAMFATGDSLEVGGNFLVNSGTSGVGDLMAGVIVLHGGFSQIAGASNNFVSASPHRVRFTGAAGGTVNFTNSTSMFGDLEIDGTGALTLTSDIRAVGTFKVAGGPSTLTSPVTQRLVRTSAMAVDGLTLDRVRIQLNSPASNTAQFDNVIFTNQDPTLTQLSLEFPGQTGDTIKLNNVTFDGTPTTGRYVYAADSAANDAVANIAFYNSFPLNGSLFTGTEGSVGDTPNVLWSHLEWQTDLVDGVELLPILAAPEIVAVDPSGNTIPGHTGTVTLSFYTDPSAGAAVLTGNVEAAVAGLATFDALTISLAGAGYQLQASSPDLGQSPPSAPFIISIPLPVGTTTAFNNGGGDNDWFNGANWTFGVPDSADNVFVFPSQSVTVNSFARANTVTIGAGGTIILNNQLVVDSSVVAGNTISGGGQLIAQGSGELSGQVGDLLVTGAYTVPTGEQLTSTGIVISGVGASLDPGQAQITSLDSLRTEAGGVLNVGYPGATVTVEGLARFTGGASSLTAGTLYIHGDFSQEENVGAFAAGPGFLTTFDGGATQTVTLMSGDTLSDHFGGVSVQTGVVLFQGIVPMMGDLQVSSGTVDITDGTVYVAGTVGGSTGAVLQGAGTLQVGGTLDFGGPFAVAHTMFVGTGQTITPMAGAYDTVTVLGTAILGSNVSATTFWVGDAGQFLMNGHRLDLLGDFGTFGTAQFAMNDPADSLMVGGSFYASGGPTTGLLTDGLLQVGGNFIQGTYVPCCIEIEVTGPPPAFNSFDAEVGHTTRLVGGLGARIVYFSNPLEPPGSGGFAGASSKFGTLELIDGVDSLLSVVPVAGATTIAGGALYDGTLAAGGPLTVGSGVAELAVASLYTGGGIDYQAPSVTYNVAETFFFGGDSIPVLPYQWLRVGFAAMALQGDLAVSQVTLGGQGEGPGDSYPGHLILNGHTLTTTGAFTAEGFGTFQMSEPTDSLDIGGDLSISGYATSLPVAGTLVARGNFFLSTDSGFVAGGTHKTVFDGGNRQLWITASHENGNKFQDVTIRPGSFVELNQFQVGTMNVDGDFWAAGYFQQASPAQKVVIRGDLYVGTAIAFVVDTVELHQELEVDASTYSTQLTRYAGTGQSIEGGVTYLDVEVTGTASVDTGLFVNRTLKVAGHGQLTVGPVALQVFGNFATVDSGTLVMIDPMSSMSADTAIFAGGNTTGLLTAGTFLARSFIQDDATDPRSYVSTGTHITHVGYGGGASEYLIQMASPGPGASRIERLELNDAGLGHPTRIIGHVFVSGDFISTFGSSGAITGDPGATVTVLDTFQIQNAATDIMIDTLVLHGAVVTPNQTLQSQVVRFAGAGMVIPDTQNYSTIEITGTATPEPAVIAQRTRIYGTGRLTINSGQGYAGNVLRTEENGTLEMAGPTAQLQIIDTLVMAGGSTAGLLRQGFLTLSGDLLQSDVNSAQSFAVDSQMYTFFTNPAGQVVSMATPGNAGSHFGFVNLQPNAVVSINATGTVPVWGEMNIQNGANLGSNAGIDVAQNMVSGSGSMVTAPLFILRTGSAPDLSTTWNVGRTVFAGADTLNIPQVNYLGDVEIWTLGRFVYPLTIGGTLRIGGAGTHAYASWSGVGVTANGLDVIDNSQFGMTNGLDSLIINGTAHFDGGYLADQLTAGTIIFGGDIVQDSTWLTQSFGFSGATVEFTPTVTHKLTFASPDNSPWPYMTTGGQGGDLNLLIIGRLVVAGGGIDANGIILSGDTLELSGPLDAGSSQITINLVKYFGPTPEQFANVGAWNTTTTHFATGGTLPSNDFTFDTLIVSSPVFGRLSQNIDANYVEVTSFGNPKHTGDEQGLLYLDGGDGNTDLTVTGDVVVRGQGAGIWSSQGNLTATGDLTVDQEAYLRSEGPFSGGSWSVQGTVTFDGGSTKDSLTNGHLAIGKDFIQKGTTSGESFAASPGFTVEFGSGAHIVSFQTPSAAGGGGSHFGSLAFAADAGIVMQTDTDLFVEGTLTTSGYVNPVLQNTAPVLRTLTAREVNIQGITFDHLQFHLENAVTPSTASIDIIEFANFFTTEDQFLVTLPGQGAGAYVWSNFTFTQLDTGGGDSGRYVVATDYDGSFPFLGIQIGTNQGTSGELGYYVGLSGATVNPFSP